MNEKIRKLVRTNTVLYMLLLLAFAGVTVKVSPILAVCEVGAAVLVWYVSHRRSKLMQQQLHQYVERISGGADTAKASNMLFAPMPMMVFNPDSDDVLWANDLFMGLPKVGNDIFESRVGQVVPNFETHWLLEGKSEYPTLFTWNGATVSSAASPSPRARGIWGCWPPPTGWTCRIWSTCAPRWPKQGR